MQMGGLESGVESVSIRNTIVLGGLCLLLIACGKSQVASPGDAAEAAQKTLPARSRQARTAGSDIWMEGYTYAPFRVDAKTAKHFFGDDPYFLGAPSLSATSSVYVARYPMEPLTSGTVKTAVYWSLFAPRSPIRDRWEIAWIFLSTDVDGSHSSFVDWALFDPAMTLPSPPVEVFKNGGQYTYDPTNGLINGMEYLVRQ